MDPERRRFNVNNYLAKFSLFFADNTAFLDDLDSICYVKSFDTVSAYQLRKAFSLYKETTMLKSACKDSDSLARDYRDYEAFLWFEASFAFLPTITAMPSLPITLPEKNQPMPILVQCWRKWWTTDNSKRESPIRTIFLPISTPNSKKLALRPTCFCLSCLFNRRWRVLTKVRFPLNGQNSRWTNAVLNTSFLNTQLLMVSILVLVNKNFLRNSKHSNR